MINICFLNVLEAFLIVHAHDFLINLQISQRKRPKYEFVNEQHNALHCVLQNSPISSSEYYNNVLVWHLDES